MFNKCDSKICDYLANFIIGSRVSVNKVTPRRPDCRLLAALKWRIHISFFKLDTKRTSVSITKVVWDQHALGWVCSFPPPRAGEAEEAMIFLCSLCEDT